MFDNIDVSVPSIFVVNCECLNKVSNPESSVSSKERIDALTNVSKADLVWEVFVGSYLKFVDKRICNISASTTSGLTVSTLKSDNEVVNVDFSAVVKLFENWEGFKATNTLPYFGGSLSSPPHTAIESAPGYSSCNLAL